MTKSWLALIQIMMVTVTQLPAALPVTPSPLILTREQQQIPMSISVPKVAQNKMQTTHSPSAAETKLKTKPNHVYQREQQISTIQQTRKPSPILLMYA